MILVSRVEGTTLPPYLTSSVLVGPNSLPPLVPARKGPLPLGLRDSLLYRTMFLVRPHLSNSYPSVKVDLGLLLRKLLMMLCSALLSHYAVNVYCVPDWL